MKTTFTLAHMNAYVSSSVHTGYTYKHRNIQVKEVIISHYMNGHHQTLKLHLIRILTHFIQLEIC